MARKDHWAGDEMMEGYVSRYELDNGLTRELANTALDLITSVRALAQLKFANRNLATGTHLRTSKRLMEIQMFHTSPHTGYNQLLHDMTVMLAAIRDRIDEKFPEEIPTAGTANDGRKRHHPDQVTD